MVSAAMEKLAFAMLMATLKLKQFFQDHTITVLTHYPLKQILHKLEASGRLMKWAIKLSQFDTIPTGRRHESSGYRRFCY